MNEEKKEWQCEKFVGMVIYLALFVCTLNGTVNVMKKTRFIEKKIKEKTMYNMIRHLNILTEERHTSFRKVQTIYHV